MQQQLTDWLLAKQCQLDEDGQLSLPDYAAQLAAVACGRAYTWLSKFALLRIGGDDAAAFLQGQFSCDVQEIAQSGVSWGSYSTAKGRVQASFLLIGVQGVFYLLLRADIAEVFRKRLSMFVLRAKVSIERVDEQWPVLAAQGDVAAASSMPQLLQADAGQLQLVLNGGTRLYIGGDVAANLARLDGSHQAVGSAAWEQVFVQAGLPWVSQATYEEFVPQMLNLDLLGGISFKKGCYPGQEIVARTQYLGKIKRRLFRAHIGGAKVKEGSGIVADGTGEQVIGRIVQAVELADSNSECLLVMQTAAWSDNPRIVAYPESRLQKLPLPYAITDDE